MSASQLQIGTFQDFVISLGRVAVGLAQTIDHHQRVALIFRAASLTPVAITSISAHRVQ